MNKSKNKIFAFSAYMSLLLMAMLGIFAFGHTERKTASANTTIYNYYVNSEYNSGLFLCPGCNNRYKLSYSSINSDTTVHFNFVESGENAKANSEHTTLGIVDKEVGCHMNITCTYSGGSYNYVIGYHQTGLPNTNFYNLSVYRTDVKATEKYCADHYWTCKKCNSTSYELSGQRNQTTQMKHEFAWKNAEPKIHKEVCKFCAYETGKMETCKSFSTSTIEATSSYCQDKKFTCNTCSGYYYEKSNSTGRTFHSQTQIGREEPTCTTAGHTEGSYCSNCNYVFVASEEIAALGHSYKETKKNATCTSGGSTFYQCTRCDYSYTGNVTAALGHNYVNQKIAASCSSGGYTNHICSRCGNSYQDGRTNALGHNLISSKKITCTEESIIYSCSRCSYSYTTKIGEGTGHDYIASITEPTCTTKGYTIFRCSKCLDSYRDNEINPLGHDYVIEEGSDCQSGRIIHVCTRCKDRFLETLEVGTEHIYEESVTAPTCTEAGYTTFICTRCGKSYRDREISALGHKFTKEEKPSTCTEFGKIIYTCQTCGFVKEENSNLYPMGHSYTNTVTVPPTCTSDGVRKSICDVCGEVSEYKISAQGHQYEITASENSGDNTIRTYTCSVCGSTYTQELGDQYVQVTNYVEYLFEEYSPYMFWVLLATAGLWSNAIGVAIIIAVRNDDKAKAKKMLINYLIGLVVIAVIVVACPYLIRGIASLVS